MRKFILHLYVQFYLFKRFPLIFTILLFTFVVPDRNGYREEYINCADVSIGQITPVAGAGNLSPDPVASGASNLDNASTADMTNSELLEALLVLADVNPVPDKVTPLSNPISTGTQPEGNVAKHEELIHQLQSLGVLVPVDTPNQAGPNSVESLFTSPDAHSNPDYFLEQLQNLGVLVPVDPTPTSTNTAAQQPTPSQSSTSSNMMQSIAPNINQSPGAHMMPQNQQQLLQPLQDIGVLVPVDQALKSGEQSNKNVFKAQETKIQNNRENELAKQLEGLGVIVPVGHIVQSPNNPATKDVPTSHDPFNVPRSPNIRPTNTFPSQSTHSNTFQSNNFQSSQSSQNTQTQRRKSQLGDIFNTNAASHNQKTSSQQARKSSSSFSSSQDGFVVSPQTFMESSSAMFSSSSSSFSSSGSAFSSSNTQIGSVEPPGANSQFGNFGSSPNRIQLNTDQQQQQQQQQRTKSEQSTMSSRNNFSKFQSISPKSQFNNLSPQRWPQQQNQNSLSQNFQSRNSEGGFGLSGNNQQLLSPGGAFLGDVVQGSDKRQHGLQTLSSFDQGLSSPAGSLSSSSSSQSTVESSSSNQNIAIDKKPENQVIESRKETSSVINKNFNSFKSSSKTESFGNTESKSTITSEKATEHKKKTANTLTKAGLNGIVQGNTQSVSNSAKGTENIVSNVDTKSNNAVDGGINAVSSVFTKIAAENVMENVLKTTKTNLNDNAIHFQEAAVENKASSSIVDAFKKTKHASPTEEVSLNVPLNLNSDVKQGQLTKTIIDSALDVTNAHNTVDKNAQLIKEHSDLIDIIPGIEELTGSKASPVPQNQPVFEPVKPVDPVVIYDITSTPKPTTTTPTPVKKTLTIEVPSLDMLMPIQITAPPITLQKLIMTTSPATVEYTKAPTTMLPSTTTYQYTVSPSFRQVPLESINNSPAFPAVDSTKGSSVLMASSLPNSGNTTWGTREKLIDQQGRESVWVSPNDPSGQGSPIKNISIPKVERLNPSFDPNLLVQTTTETTVKELLPLGGLIKETNKNNNNNSMKRVQHGLDPFLFGIGAVPKFDQRQQRPTNVNAQVPRQLTSSKPIQNNNLKTKQASVSFKRNGLTIQKSIVQNPSVQRQSSAASVQLPNIGSLLRDSRADERQPTSQSSQNNSNQRRTTNLQVNRQQIPENTARVEVVVRNHEDSVKFFSTINNFPPAQRRRILELLRQNRVTNLQFTNPQFLARLANTQVQRVPTPIRPTQAQITHFMQRLSTTPNGRRLLQQWRQRMRNEFLQPQRAETVAPPTIVQATATPRRENASETTSTDTANQNATPTLATFLQQEQPVVNVRQQFSSAVNLVRQLQREQQAEELLQQHLQEYTRSGQFTLARTVLNTLQLLQERKSGLMQQIQELRREIQASGNRLQAEITEAPLQRSALRATNTVSPSSSQISPTQRQQSSSSSSSSSSLPSQTVSQQMQPQVNHRQQPVQAQRQQIPTLNNNQLQRFMASLQRTSLNRIQRPAGGLSPQPAPTNNREARLRNLLRNARQNPFQGINRSQNRPAFPMNNARMFG